MTDLRALAEAATPGPWTALIESYEAPGAMFVTHQPEDAQTPIVLGVAYSDAAYIAAADPTTVLALLDVLDAARRLSDKRTVDSDGFWVSQREMRYLDDAIARYDAAGGEG